MMKIRTSLAALGIILALEAPALAQDVVIDQFGTEYAPELVPNAHRYAARGGTSGPIDPMTASGSQMLVPALEGIVVLSSHDAVQARGISGIQGIYYSDDNFPPRAGNLLAGYLGKPVTKDMLKAMIRDTKRGYGALWRNVDVSFPKQNVATGVVQIVVVRGGKG